MPIIAEISGDISILLWDSTKTIAQHIKEPGNNGEYINIIKMDVN